jgi:hypothetical protein
MRKTGIYECRDERRQAKRESPNERSDLPRNLARSTTQTIARGSSGGLYQAASPPPAAIKTASLIATRLRLLKLIEIIHPGRFPGHGREPAPGSNLWRVVLSVIERPMQPFR